MDDPLDAVGIQNNQFIRDGKGIRDRWEDAKAIASSFDYRYKPGHASLLEAAAGAGHDLVALSPPPPAIVSVAASSLVTAAQTPQLPLTHGAGVGQSALEAVAGAGYDLTAQPPVTVSVAASS